MSILLDELNRRESILKEYHSVSNDARDPTGWILLKNLGIYKGQRALFRDLVTTKHLVGDGCGMAVSVQLSGEISDSVKKENGLVSIALEDLCKGTGRECTEQSLYNAMSLGLPVFLVWRKTEKDRWIVEKAWVIGCCNDAEDIQFLIEHDEWHTESRFQSESGDFELSDNRDMPRTLSSALHRSVGFSNSVRRAYEYRCAATGLEISETLEAAHIWPVSRGGTSLDVRNGILLCANVHKAFDAHRIGINPVTMRFEDNCGGLSLKQLGIDRDALKHRSSMGLPVPHSIALSKRWEVTRSRWNG